MTNDQCPPPSRKAMADEEDELLETELSYDQKKEIAKWFFLNAPAGEINYVAKGT